MIFINSSPKDGLKFLEPFSSYIVPVGIGCLLAIFEKDGISAGFVDEQVEENILEKIKSQIEEKHLKKTVKWIEENSNIEILAIGIGHDVTRYYKRAIKIADVQELGDVMINQLTKLFSEKNTKTIH